MKKLALLQRHQLSTSKVITRILSLAGEVESGISPCGAVHIVPSWCYGRQCGSRLQHLVHNALWLYFFNYYCFLLFLAL